MKFSSQNLKTLCQLVERKVQKVRELEGNQPTNINYGHRLSYSVRQRYAKRHLLEYQTLEKKTVLYTLNKKRNPFCSTGNREKHNIWKKEKIKFQIKKKIILSGNKFVFFRKRNHIILGNQPRESIWRLISPLEKYTICNNHNNHNAMVFFVL